MCTVSQQLYWIVGLYYYGVLVNNCNIYHACHVMCRRAVSRIDAKGGPFYFYCVVGREFFCYFIDLEASGGMAFVLSFFSRQCVFLSFCFPQVAHHTVASICIQLHLLFI